MKRIIIGLMTVTALAGCGRGGENKPKTAVLGERLPVLTAETGAEVDPSLADLPVSVPAPEVNNGWTQPGGNAAKSMGNPSLAAALGRAWTAKIAGSTPKARLAASPVVAEGRVYAIDIQAVVRAFDVKSGALLWSAKLSDDRENRGSLFGGGVSYEEGRLYATTGLGDAVALEAATGKQLWKVRPGGPLRGAPSIGSGNIYVLSQDNQIFALKPENGETVWNEAATLETAGVFGVAAPAVAQGTVVAGFSSGELTAFRYENGRAVWQDQLSRTSISTSVSSLSDIDASPVIDQGRVYAVGQGGRMVAMDLITGQRLWELNVAGISTPWVAGEWLFVVTDEAKLLCIARVNGKVRWITQLPRWKNEKKRSGAIGWTGPIIAGSRLLVASTEGVLQNVALEDGKIGTATRIGASVNLPPVVADNTLFVLDNDGRLSAWR
ncbi:pyrrolo-quinoline quinone [Sphingomonas oleivorans]|uniref:Pyrrolo-quinoline quinone n=1 Tax=Sphingomonas oleivorans TaxID=1735121 RepID=A0A2T5FYI8_9SPHN|nr:PQQ-like beta-propeller repeat protein [Sphingomonas oleivorans]PTQ11554.1 pyrrolo-quinoline quinone [Sphingomonas oleivorans]